MNIIKKVTDSNSTLQVFLSLCSGKRTQKEIAEDTGFSQPVVHQYLKQLIEKKLVTKKENGVMFKSGYPKRVTYSYRLEPILEMNLYSNDSYMDREVPQVQEVISILEPHCQKIIKHIAIFPLWRNDKFIERNHPRIKIKYMKVGGKKVPIISGKEAWAGYVSKNEKFRHLKFEDLAFTLLGCLVAIRDKLKEKEQNALDRYLEWHFASVDMTYYLVDY